MAATRKEYELLFQLKAALGSNFASTFKTAMQTTKQLQNTLSDVKKVQSDISGFERQQKAIETNKEKLEDLRAEHEKLQREIKETEQPSEALTQKLKKNEQQISNTTAKIKAQEQELDKLGDKLKSAGVNTDNLTGANQKLEEAYKRVKKSQERLANIDMAQQKNAAAIAATRSQLLRTVGVAGALGAAIYAGPVQSSMAFESAMADVVKVVDGLKDKSTGELTEEYRVMKKELINLSTVVPMTATELTKIAASAGQAGIARQEIVKFTEDAAKMGIAFDTTADQAGDWMAKWRTSFNMSQKDVVALADKINMLSDSTASSATEIANIVTKVGPLGEVAGLTSGQIAAMGAALVSVGIQDDVAATGIKKLAVEMTAGTSVTKRQAAVLDKMGISATELADRMQTDAQGAILDFLSAVNRLPKAEQTAALSDYFGTESVGAIAPLLTRLDLLKTSYDQIGDSAQYAGSMEREFASRSNTAENKVQLAKNSISKLCIVLGDTFLPYIGQASEKVSELVTKFADFAEKNPKVVMTIAKVAAGLMAFKVGTLGLKLAFLDIRGAVYAAQKVFALFGGNAAKASAEALTHTGKLNKLAAGIKNYFGGIKGAAGGVSTAFSGVFGGSKAAGIFKTMAGGITKVFGSTGGAITGIFASAGSKIAKGPLGKVATVLAGGFGKLLTKFIAPIGRLLMPIGNLIITALGPLAGIAGSILPVVGIVAAIVAGVQILFGNLDKVHNFIEEKFGPEAAAAFDNIMNVIKNVGSTIKKIFSDESLGNARNFLVNIFGEKSAGVIDGVITMVKTVRDIIGEFITFCNNNVRPIIETLFKFIVEEVLPIIAAKFAEWAPIISGIVRSLWTIISGIATAISQIIQFIMPVITSAIKGAVQIITGVIGGLLKVIQGILDFIVGVFTGDWEKAWNGVKDIFAGVWEGIKAVAMGPINFIKDSIGGLIDKIKDLKKGKIEASKSNSGDVDVNVRGFAKGTKRTPSAFIAGERGPELITNAPGRTVYTSKETQSFLQFIRSLLDSGMIPAMAGVGGPGYFSGYNRPATVGAVTNMGGTKITIHNSPTIHVDGAVPGDLDAKLQRNNEKLLNMFEARIRKKQDDERRQRYE